MTKIYETQNKIRRVSNKSKSLILPIPPEIRDLMAFKHQTSINWQICLNEKNEKYIKLYIND